MSSQDTNSRSVTNTFLILLALVCLGVLSPAIAQARVIVRRTPRRTVVVRRAPNRVIVRSTPVKVVVTAKRPVARKVVWVPGHWLKRRGRRPIWIEGRWRKI